MEFPLLNSGLPNDSLTKPKLHQEYRQVHVPKQTQKLPTKINKKKQLFRSFSFTSSDMKTQLKDIIQRKARDRQLQMVSKLAETSKKKLPPRPKSINLKDKKFKPNLDLSPATEASLHQYLDMFMLKESSTVVVDISNDETDFLSQDRRSVSETSDKSWKEWSYGFKSLTSRFAGDTTAHGYKNIVSDNRGKYRKRAWIAAILCVTAVLFAFIFSAWSQYQSHSFTSIVKSLPARDLPFPAVTVCNLYPWNLSKENLKWNQEMEIEEPHLNQSTYNQLQLNSFNLSVARFREMYGMKIHNFFTSCRWNYQSLPCHTMFTRTPSDISDCYSFNLNQSSPHRATSISRLIINLRLLKRPSQLGVKVVIHSQEEFPNVIEKGILVGPGTLAHIGLTRNEYQFLPRPYMAYGVEYCEDIDYNNNHLHYRHYYPDYSGHSACHANCRLQHIIKQCNCLNVDNPVVENIKSCHMKHLDCYYRALNHSYSFKHLCKCPLPCHKTEYSWRMSGSYQGNDDITVRVFYENLVTRKEEHLAMETWTSLFGNIGGQMGLLTGASVLTMIEFLELIGVIIFVSWGEIRQRIKDILQKLFGRRPTSP